jgi:ankyrin repeat protein
MGAEDLLSLAEKGFHHDELRRELRASPKAAQTLHDAERRTALHLSAMHGQFEDVLLLLEAGARIDVLDEAGYTPLRYALEGRPREYALLCAQVLVAGGANVNLVDEGGNTPLSIAVANGFHPAAAFLISQGAEVEPQGVPAEQQPLAIARRRNDAEMVALLDHARGWASKKLPDAARASDSVNARFLAAVRAGNIPLVIDLIQQGAGVDTADADGATALYSAVKEHRTEVVPVLLYNGADPNLAKKDGSTPLMAAMPFFDIKGTGVFLMLLQFGAEVNAETKDGRTPLSAAVAACNNFTAKWCIWRGAKLDVKTPKGTLMQIAKARPDWPSMIDVLKQGGVSDDEALPLSKAEAAFNAVRLGNLEAVEAALKDGVAVDATDEVGAPMLAWAAHYKRLDIVDLLLKHGANVDQRNAKTSKTTLQEFALYGKDGNDQEAADRMQELLDRGADPNVVTKDGFTALMLAARTGTKGANLQLLLKLTKDLNARNNDGKTALGLAREYGNQDVAEILVSHGAME